MKKHFKLEIQHQEQKQTKKGEMKKQLIELRKEMWEGEDDIISEIKKKLQNSQEKTHSNKNFIRDIEERQKNNHQKENEQRKT